ncbi:MAG: SH3 domain-containing protein [Oscillospiraceae bacterium]|nr:SH3 domain-containing protein [Oscillospiraceae bacterium]
MSNNDKRKCPSCGAMMPAEIKYCRKCQARMDAPEDDLPRPIRPEWEQEQQPKKTARSAASERQTRTREMYESSREKPQHQDSGNPARFIAVLALLVVIIVVAVVLVIKLNNADTADTGEAAQQESETYVIETVVTPAADNTAEEDDAAAAAEESGDETADAEEEEYEAVSDVVYTTGSGVNLRSGPGTDYEVIASVASGTELARSAITGNWSEVTYEGQVCYVNNSLITTEAPTSSEDDGVTVYVVGDVNLRSGPDTSYDVVAVATAGTALTRTGTTGDWSIISYNGETVYAYSSYLSTTATAAETTTDTAEDSTTESTTTDVPTSTEDVVSASGTVYTTAGINLRSGPGTSYDIVASALAGTALTRTGTTGDWTQVSYGGQTAYVYNEYISTDSTDASLSSQSGTLTIISEANVRSGPGTTYEVLGVAAVGDTLTITGYTSTNWYQVEYESAIGYIAGNLVSVN